MASAKGLTPRRLLLILLLLHLANRLHRQERRERIRRPRRNTGVDRVRHVGRRRHATEQLVRDMREQEIGQAQAWYYSQDKTIVLWECELHRPFEEAPVHRDPNMHDLWSGFEQFLTAQFPDAVQIATTYSDPSYETAEYQEFLTALGYSPHPTAKAAWSKEIQRAA